MITKRSINTMLGKEKLKGEQVGRVLIAGGIYQYKEAIENKEYGKELLNLDELKNLENKIVENYEISTYNNYVGLSRWTAFTCTLCTAHIATIEGINAYFKELLMATSFVLDVNRYVKSLPYIVTQKEYDDEKAEFIKGELDTEPLNTYECLELALMNSFESYEKGTLENKSLVNVFKKYASEPVASPLILREYNNVNGIGYNELPDGTRSDEMSAEEWQEAITKPEYKTPPQTPEGAPESEKVHRAALVIEAQYKSMDEKTQYPYTFHPSDVQPVGVCKADILGDSALSLYYAGNESGELDEEAKAKVTARYKDFYNEYKEALDIIIEESKTRYNLDISTTPLDEWYTTTYENSTLYKLNFFGYKDYLQDDENAFIDNPTAFMNGIAIVRPCSGLALTIKDEAYKAPSFNTSLFRNVGLERFTAANPEKEKELEYLDNKIEELQSEVYYINAVSVAIGLVAERIKLPDYNLFAPDIKGVLAKIEAMEALFKSLYVDIKQQDDRLDEHKDEKLRLLKNRLCNLSNIDLTIPKARLKLAQEKINDMKTFRSNGDEIRDILYYKQR